MSNRQLDEINENKGIRHLAGLLGVTYNELSECDYEIHDDVTDDGVLTGHRVRFDSNTSKKILMKVGADTNYEVYLDLGSFSDE